MFGVIIAALRAVFGKVLAEFFGGEIKSIALIAAYTAAFLALTIGLFALFKTIGQGLYMAAPAVFQWGFGFLPDNVSSCLTAIIDARIAWWIYSYKSGLLNKKIIGYGRR